MKSTSNLNRHSTSLSIILCGSSFFFCLSFDIFVQVNCYFRVYHSLIIKAEAASKQQKKIDICIAKYQSRLSKPHVIYTLFDYKPDCNKISVTLAPSEDLIY